MDKRKIAEYIISVFKRYSHEKVEEDSEIHFLNLDSLDFVKIIVEIEDYFDMEIDDETLYISNGVKIKDFIDYVDQKIN